MGLNFEVDDSEVEKLAVRMRTSPMVLGGWRRRRAAEQLARAPSPQAVTELARALTTSRDQRVVQIALAALRGLYDEARFNAACRVWDETHDPRLGALLVEHVWLISRPAAVQVLTAMRVGRMDVLLDGDARIARALVSVEEHHPALREQARTALRALRQPEAREAVCALAINDANPVALEAAVAGDFAPDPVRRAVLFYLAGEFDRYAELDFDGSLLATAHATAGQSLHTRLAERARESGRVEWVRAVASRQARRIAQLSDAEWKDTVAVLVAAAQWDQLWRLALEAPPVWGVRMLGELGQRDWRPPAEADWAIYHQLCTLAARATKPPAFDESAALEAKRSCGELVISPDSRLLASGSKDGTVRLWRLPSGEPGGTLTGHTRRVDALAVSPDGKLLASGSKDKTVRLWRLPSGEPTGILTGHTDEIWCLAVSPDGKLLASGASLDRTVRLWRLPSGMPAGILTGHTARVWCLVVSPDGKLLASGSEDGTVRLWRLPSGEPAGTRTGHTNFISCLAVSPDGRLLASGGADGTVRLWRLPSGEPAGTLTGHVGWVSQVVVNPDGKLLASGGKDKMVRLWRLPSGEPAGTLTGHTGSVRTLAVSPDGKLLGIGSNGGTVRLWESKLLALSHNAVGKISLADIERLHPSTGGYSNDARAWVELITTLVRWRHRYDIEVDVAPGAVEAGASDIELDG